MGTDAVKFTDGRTHRAGSLPKGLGIEGETPLDGVAGKDLSLPFSPLQGGKNEEPREAALREVWKIRLDFSDVHGGRAFAPLSDLETDAVSFVQRPESGHINGGMMNKDVPAVVLLDKAVTFFITEPLNFSFRQDRIPLEK